MNKVLYIDDDQINLKLFKEELKEEDLCLQEELEIDRDFKNIISNDPAFRQLLKKAEQVAITKATVLLLGETGTGKELVVIAIHDISNRRTKSFVRLNCAAKPETLMESELFGHVKGAFTGAAENKKGKFELANQGIINFGYKIEKRGGIKFFASDSFGKLSLNSYEEAFETYKHRLKGIDPFFDLSSLRMIVSKENVGLMGGGLMSEPHNKAGMTFYFSLPIAEKLSGISDTSDATNAYPDWGAKTIIVASETRKTDSILPIIGQTSYSLENSVDLSTLGSFNSFLTKPIWYHELVT